MSTEEKLTRAERNDMAKLVRQQAAVAKSMALERAAELRAAFEDQLDTLYSYDDNRVWSAAMREAEAACSVAAERVAKHCDELGIPRDMRPHLSANWSYGGGRTLARERKTEMRRVAHERIDAMVTSAKRAIEAASVEAQARVVGMGLTSEAAQLVLAGLPKASSLMPPLTVDDVRKLQPGNRAHGAPPPRLFASDGGQSLLPHTDESDALDDDSDDEAGQP